MLARSSVTIFMNLAFTVNIGSHWKKFEQGNVLLGQIIEITLCTLNAECKDCRKANFEIK